MRGKRKFKLTGKVYVHGRQIARKAKLVQLQFWNFQRRRWQAGPALVRSDAKGRFSYGYRINGRRVATITPYTLRHSFASLLIHEGRSVVEVASQLGHSPTIALNTYGHIFADFERSDGFTALGEIERVLGA